MHTKSSTAFFLLTLVFCCTTLFSRAQPAHAGEYISVIGNAHAGVTQKYLNYISAVSHGKRARKVEKLRTKLLTDIDDARYKFIDMGPWNGDKTLKDAAVDHMLLLYRVFNEDYAKIVDMEEIAEQSYDGMEAYMLAQEKANEKLELAGKKLDSITKEFAKKNNVNLVRNESANDEKMKIVNKVYHYYNRIYLVFFKSSKQEMYMLEAIGKNDLNGTEQSKNSLAKYAAEGLGILDTMKAFEADRTLINATKKVLEFYKSECTTGIPAMSDFILKMENFEKLKKDFEAKNDHSKEEIDAYNKAVNDLNKGADTFNKTGQSLNEKRNRLVQDYEQAVTAFLDGYVPK